MTTDKPTPEAVLPPQDRAANSDMAYVQQQVYLLEDTVMTMSMAVTSISKGINLWAKVIYPMMAAFVILAGYGFYLIYNLTYDIGMMSNNMAHMTQVVDKNLNIIASEVRSLHATVNNIDSSLKSVRDQMHVMTGEMVTMDDTMNRINDNMGHMVTSTNRMGTDLWDLNRSISGPMSTVNKWAPWQMMGGRKEPPPPPQAVPPQSYPYYYGVPAPVVPSAPATPAEGQQHPLLPVPQTGAQ